MLEGQDDVSYSDMLSVARRAEALGFDGLYRSDHYSAGDARRVASTDAWATLAGLARETQHITLGTLVTPATFRPVGNLAKVVATVAEMAGTTTAGAARVVLGMGTGWMEVEHRRHGFAFEDLTTRYARLEEQLEMLRRLWDPLSQPFDFDGTFVTIADADFWPPPDPRPRIIIGGSGLRKTPRLAALYGDELNAVFLSPDQCRAQRAALDAACRDADRDPAAVRYSLMTRCLVGRTLDEFRDRAARSQQHAGRSGSLIDYINSLQPHWLVGTVDRVRGLLDEFAEAGVEQVMLQHLLVEDLEMLELVAEELLED